MMSVAAHIGQHFPVLVAIVIQLIASLIYLSHAILSKSQYVWLRKITSKIKHMYVLITSFLVQCHTP